MKQKKEKKKKKNSLTKWQCLKQTRTFSMLRSEWVDQKKHVTCVHCYKITVQGEILN